MAQESDSDDSDSFPAGRPGGMGDDLFFIPVMQNEAEINERRRVTITQNNANEDNNDDKSDSDDDNGNGNNNDNYNNDTTNNINNNSNNNSNINNNHNNTNNVSFVEDGTQFVEYDDVTDMKDENLNDNIDTTNNINNNSNDNSNNNIYNNNNNSNNHEPQLNAVTSEPPVTRVDESKNAKNGRSAANLGSNLKQMAHHNDESTFGDSISSEFHRDTKWDVVYLTSSPLVFGTGTYKPLDQLNIKEEREQFFSTLKASGKQLKVIHSPATTSNIIAAVTGGSKCIHYSGHGYPNFLAFEDAKRIGETHLVHYDLIRRVCEDEDQRIEFVFASACHSEHVGKAFVEAGIPHVVAVKKKWEVTDEAAACFTKHFYDTLLNGFSIAKAFQTAKNAVASMNSSARLDATKFLLLPEDKSGKRHNVTLFDNLKNGPFIDDSKSTSPNNLPPSVQQFVGRAIDMRHIISKLMDTGVKLLILTGDHGIGKSATSLMVARYFCDRRMFKGGLFFVDVPKMQLNPECQRLEQMLLRAFRESGDETILQKFGKEGDITDSELFNKMRHMGEMLLVFDGLDKFEIRDNMLNSHLNNNNNYNGINTFTHNHNNNSILLQTQETVQSFLQNVFDRTSVETKVLVTSEKKLHMFANFTGCISRYYQLRPLKPKDAAILFSRLANQFRHTDIVSHARLMQLLECNPLKISQVVQLKHRFNCSTLEKIVEAYEMKQKIQSHPQALALSQYKQKKEEKRRRREHLASKHINDQNARQLWLKAKGMETAQYHMMFDALKEELTRFINGDRQLQAKDLMEPFKHFGMRNDLTFPIQYFDSLYQWFNGLCDIFTVLRDVWNETDPVMIHGFVTRSESERRLQQTMAGTFIIRFSFTNPKSIAISYRETENARHRVTHVKASLASNNEFQFELNTNGQTNLRPMTLGEFIRKYKKIEYLFDENNRNRIIHKTNVNFDNNNKNSNKNVNNNNNNNNNTDDSNNNDTQQQQQQQQQNGYNMNMSPQQQQYQMNQMNQMNQIQNIPNMAQNNMQNNANYPTQMQYNQNQMYIQSQQPYYQAQQSAHQQAQIMTNMYNVNQNVA